MCKVFNTFVATPPAENEYFNFKLSLNIYKVSAVYIHFAV